MLPNGVHYSVENATKAVGQNFANHMFKFFYDINQLNLSKSELAIIIPFVLSISSMQ